MKPIVFALLLTLIVAGVAHPAMAETLKIVIAHRGASGYLPEHTLEAKALAYAMGADYLEQDVVLSRDDVPMVLHDIYIDTVTDVAKRFPDRCRADHRYYAMDFTLAELKQLVVTERFDFKTGQPVFKSRFPQWQAAFAMPTFEEEIQFIQGLNRTTGRNVGIYPEIKAPAWHKSQGKDLSRIVINVLARYGYRTKEHLCFLQCFDYTEVKRLRTELGYQGRIIQLLGENNASEPGTDYTFLRTRPGLEELAKVADGIGPSLSQVVIGRNGSQFQITELVRQAHAFKLAVHPYTIRADTLPKYAASVEEVYRAFLIEADVDGVFTDHPDRGADFLRRLREQK